MPYQIALSTYDRFTYGKLDPFSPEKILSTSNGLVGKKDILTNIVNKYKFWQPPFGKNQRQAVGVFKLDNVDDDSLGNSLVLVRASAIQSKNYGTYPLYQYIFVPYQAVAEAKLPHSLCDILMWLAETSIPKIENSLEKIYIPLLDIQKTNEYKKDDLETCLKKIETVKEEKDHDDTSYLFSALTALLTDQSVLINLAKPSAANPIAFLKSIIRLLPVPARHELSTVIGDFDENMCSWAKLLVKATPSDAIERNLIGHNCVWLNREIGAIHSMSQGSDLKSQQLIYIAKIKEILSQPDRDWSKSLLQELDTLESPSWTLENLKYFQSQNQAESKEINLGLWGVSSAGKTTYILHLYECMSNSDSGFNILAKDQASQDFLRRRQQELGVNRQMLPTDPQLGSKTISYRIETKYTLLPQAINLRFIDIAGKFYEDLAIFNTTEDAVNIKTQGEESLVEHLIKCNGIIFLMSAEHEAKPDKISHKVMIPNVLQLLRLHANSKGISLGNQERLQQFIAFCATKVDKEGLWEFRKKPNKLVKSILGSAVDKLGNHCYYDEERVDQIERNRCKFFAVSSIGRHWDDEENDWVESIDYPDRSDSENTDEYSTKKIDNDYFKSQSSFSDEKVDEVFEENVNEGNSTDDQENFVLGFLSSSLKGNSKASEESSQSFSNEQLVPTIKMGVDPIPFNVVEPVKWLIRKIYASR